ncbi:unnamed protein product [Amoebophrya sp. A25]|nr:unnamed protein product [Amoebophrya sp. A25]|eukprot:GSA25T00000036001.1
MNNRGTSSIRSICATATGATGGVFFQKEQEGGTSSSSTSKAQRRKPKPFSERGDVLSFEADHIVLNGRRYPHSVQQLPYPVEAFNEDHKVADVPFLITVDGSRELELDEATGRLLGERSLHADGSIAKAEDQGGTTKKGGLPNSNINEDVLGDGTNGMKVIDEGSEDSDALLAALGLEKPAPLSGTATGAGAFDVDEGTSGATASAGPPRQVPSFVKPHSMGLTNVRRSKSVAGDPGDVPFTEQQIQEAWVTLLELAERGSYTYCEDVQEINQAQFLELKRRFRTQEWKPGDSVVSGHSNNQIAGGSKQGGPPSSGGSQPGARPKSSTARNRSSARAGSATSTRQKRALLASKGL